MRKKICDYKYGILFILTDIYGNARSVSLDDDTVKRKRDGGPLVLLDTAIVMGLEKSHFGILVKRVLLQIESG